MADALQEAFSELGVTVDRMDVGAMAPVLRLSRAGTSPSSVLLNGHYDTVFGPEHPFKSVTETADGLLRGPGVADMKGGLLVLLETLRMFETLPCARALGWEVLLTPDEEIGSPKGGPVLTSAASRHTLALIFESTPVDGRFVRRRPAVGTFRLEMTGKAAHAGRDFTAGRNALVRLAQALTRVDVWSSPSDGVLCNVARFNCDAPLNVVPDHASAEVGVRAFTRQAVTDLQNRFRLLAGDISTEDGFTLRCQGAFSRPPKEITPADEALFARVRASARGLGLSLDWADTGGASDGNLLSAAGLPVIDCLGVRGGGLHGDGEFAVLASLPERVALATHLLARLAADADAGLPLP